MMLTVLMVAGYFLLIRLQIVIANFPVKWLHYIKNKSDQLLENVRQPFTPKCSPHFSLMKQHLFLLRFFL